MAGSVTIQGLLPGVASGTEYIGPFTIPANSAGNFEVQTVQPSFANAFSIQTLSWATMLVINPGSVNTQTLALVGGLMANTGFALSPTNVTLLALTGATEIWFLPGGAFVNPITFITA